MLEAINIVMVAWPGPASVPRSIPTAKGSEDKVKKVSLRSSCLSSEISFSSVILAGRILLEMGTISASIRQKRIKIRPKNSIIRYLGLPRYHSRACLPHQGEETIEFGGFFWRGFLTSLKGHRLAGLPSFSTFNFSEILYEHSTGPMAHFVLTFHTPLTYSAHI